MLMFDQDIDFTADLNGNGIPDYLEVGHLDIMGWANPAHVPFMVYTVVFAGTFSIMGYTGQWFYYQAFNDFANWMLSLPLTSVLTLAVCRQTTVLLARIMPKDITSAVSIETLYGQSGILNVGPISGESSGVMRVADQYATDHNLIVFAEEGKNIALGKPVVLVGPHKTKTYAYVVREISASF